MIIVLEVTGASVYYAEAPDPNANIVTAGDAIWWGLVTITTVGYGDQYPVTELGRIIGTFLLFAGVGLFSVITGFIANAFLAPPAKPRLKPRDRASSEIADVRTLLAEQDERAAAIRAHLDELEKRIEDSRSPSRPDRGCQARLRGSAQTVPTHHVAGAPAGALVGHAGDLAARDLLADLLVAQA